MIDEAAFLRICRGEARGLLAVSARAVLASAAVPYRFAVAARNAAFDRGWKSRFRAAVPVMSIGNITLGGTGKTPMVEWTARFLRERGLRVAILSRGYGGKGRINDEGLVLEENLPDVPHLQGADRCALARIAAEELESEVVVLDDGFQHRRLARDLDIVLLDALDPFGLGRMFPRGLLREPISALKRAGVVVLSRADLVSPETRSRIRERAERHAGPLRWAECRHAPRDLIGEGVEPKSIGTLGGRKVLAFCGLGNPTGFRRTVESLGAEIVGFRAFPDHHAYTRGDVESLASEARGAGAEVALTSQKDSVKLRTPTLGAVPLRALRIGLAFIDGRDVVERTIAAVLPSDVPG